MNNLTKKQLAVYNVILRLYEEKGYPPSVREIGEAAGLKSPSTVHAHLKALGESGLIQKDSRKTRALNLRDSEAAANHPGKVPILGRVAAGQPILAEENCEGWLAYDTGGKGGEFYALRVRGDSMVDAGIFEGDYVVVRQQQTADSGQIVVAMIDEEATVKRLRKKGRDVWLMPENAAHQPIDGRGCSILGRVTGVVRHYV
jgi:repressor LexA